MSWKCLNFTDLPLFSPVREIRGYQRFQHLHTRPSHQRGQLPSSPIWCPGELSETLWAWRTVRRPPVTPCSTSASTWPSVTWTKPSSLSSSSRGKASVCATCIPSVHVPAHWRHAEWHACCGHIPVLVRCHHFSQHPFHRRFRSKANQRPQG